MIDHHIVVGSIIASNRENLRAVELDFRAVIVSCSYFYIIQEILTLSAIPKSLRTSVKATARLNPLWDHATLMISSRREIGMPSCSKCTVIATNAL